MTKVDRQLSFVSREDFLFDFPLSHFRSDNPAKLLLFQSESEIQNIEEEIYILGGLGSICLKGVKSKMSRNIQIVKCNMDHGLVCLGAGALDYFLVLSFKY